MSESVVRLYPSKPEPQPSVSPPAVDGGGGPPHSPDMTELTERLGRVELSVAKIEAETGFVKWYVGLLTAIMLGGFTFLGTQLARIEGRVDKMADRLEATSDKLNAKIDAIPALLSQEFRAMRAETAAQTSAIANSISAAKQTPPQVILVPAPEPAKPAP